MGSVNIIPVYRSYWLAFNDLMSYQYKKAQVSIAILDFSKAFDVVPHTRLLKKIEHDESKKWQIAWKGLPNPIAKDTECSSGWITLQQSIHGESGFPPGTVLGSLFLLYINDLLECVSSHICLFDDGYLLYSPIRSITEQLQLQESLNALRTWANTWGHVVQPLQVLYTNQNPE